MKRPLPRMYAIFFLRIPSKCGKQALAKRQQRKATTELTRQATYLICLQSRALLEAREGEQYLNDGGKISSKDLQ